MGVLEGRVAIITGAGNGVGREHALLFAREGARVVVNDLGGSPEGEGANVGPAKDVVQEITAAGGEAVANTDNVASWAGAKRLIDQAIETFGDLHVLVNNAGIFRDRMLVNMSEHDWDSVVDVDLKGHFCPTRHAAEYWRNKSKAGATVQASIVHTSSASGLLGNVGQTNYGAAKAGVEAFSNICGLELARYGVRSNAIAPSARTRLTASLHNESDKEPEDEEQWDPRHPGNVSPLVAFLATAECSITGETFHVSGEIIPRYEPHTIVGHISSRGHRWSVSEIADTLPALMQEPIGGGLQELQSLSKR